MIQVIRSIDAHVGGAAVRLVVEGAPTPGGKGMAQKRDWMKRHAERLRRGIMLEPRGHADLAGALLTEPVTPGSDAGILFMDAGGFTPLSGAGVIAAATIAIEKGLVTGSAPRLAFDTPIGTVHAEARVQNRGDGTRVDSVSFTNVPSHVVAGGHALRLGAREVRVDIAFGGALYAIVDTEAIGVPLEVAMLPELRRLAAQIRDAAAAPAPDTPRRVLDGVVFTGPPIDPEAHLRNITIAASGAVDRSASATGTSAVMAVLDAMGLLGSDAPFVHEGLAGTLHHGTIARRTEVEGHPAIVPRIDGSAWITGEHTFYIDEDDPLRIE